MSIDTEVRASSISISFTPYAKNNTSLLCNLDKIEQKESEVSNQILQKEEQINSLKSEKAKIKGLTNNQIQDPPVPLNQKYVQSNRSEKIFLSIEKTSIRNMSGNNNYYYKVLKNSDGVISEIYESRKTILERPCWRDNKA